jgi:hypothetical protein
MGRRGAFAVGSSLLGQAPSPLIPAQPLVTPPWMRVESLDHRLKIHRRIPLQLRPQFNDTIKRLY